MAGPCPTALRPWGKGGFIQFTANYFTEMCSGSEAASYLRLIDFVYHSTLGLRVIKKKKVLPHEADIGLFLKPSFRESQGITYLPLA